MTGLLVKVVVPAAIVAAGIGGYWLGQNGGPTPLLGQIEAMLVPASSAAPSPPGPVLYYRHPDGLPFYSATPKTSDDGRLFVALDNTFIFVTSDNGRPSNRQQLRPPKRDLGPNDAILDGKPKPRQRHSP